MARTLLEIDAEIAEMEQARRDFLTGKRRSEVNYGGDSVRYAGDASAVLDSINNRLTELRNERADVAGTGSTKRRPLLLGF